MLKEFKDFIHDFLWTSCWFIYFVDEDDADWEDMEDVAEKPQDLDLEDLSPFGTINS